MENKINIESLVAKKEGLIQDKRSILSSYAKSDNDIAQFHAFDTYVELIAKRLTVEFIDQLTDKELSEVTSKLNVPHFFTSAKTGENVNNAFITIGKKLFL